MTAPLAPVVLGTNTHGTALTSTTRLTVPTLGEPVATLATRPWHWPGYDRTHGTGRHAYLVRPSAQQAVEDISPHAHRVSGARSAYLHAQTRLLRLTAAVTTVALAAGVLARTLLGWDWALLVGVLGVVGPLWHGGADGGWGNGRRAPYWPMTHQAVEVRRATADRDRHAQAVLAHLPTLA